MSRALIEVSLALAKLAESTAVYLKQKAQIMNDNIKKAETRRKRNEKF